MASVKLSNAINRLAIKTKNLINAITNAINEIKVVANLAQPKTDATLTTSNKDIAPAINEVNVGKNTNTNDIASLKGKPVRTIDANGAEIGMSLGAYTTSALDNGLADRSVITKLVNDAIASAINALPKTPTRKDITATYATRVWNANDSGKKVWITASRNGIKVGFISEGADTTFSSGGAVVDLGISYTNTDKQFRLYWSTEHVSNVGNIVLHTDSKIEIFETAYHITKFEIEE